MTSFWYLGKACNNVQHHAVFFKELKSLRELKNKMDQENPHWKFFNSQELLHFLNPFSQFLFTFLSRIGVRIHNSHSIQCEIKAHSQFPISLGKFQLCVRIIISMWNIQNISNASKMQSVILTMISNDNYMHQVFLII